MSQYKQLTEAQRYQIDALMEASVDGYHPKQAHRLALRRRHEARKAVKMTTARITIVEAKIRMEWSHEQLSGWLKTERTSVNIMHISNLVAYNCKDTCN